LKAAEVGGGLAVDGGIEACRRLLHNFFQGRSDFFPQGWFQSLNLHFAGDEWEYG
jgi:hypothetical protein